MESRHESGIVSAGHGGNDGCDGCGVGHDPTCHEPGSYIEETQRLDTDADMHINVVSSPEEEGDNDWGYVRGSSPGLCSPPLKQKRGDNVADVVLEES